MYFFLIPPFPQEASAIVLTIFITLFFLFGAQQLLNEAPSQEASNFGEALGGALGTAMALVVLIGGAILFGIAAFVLGSVSISILSTCIKSTEKGRKTANIVVISLVGALLLAIIIGLILIFTLNRG